MKYLITYTRHYKANGFEPPSAEVFTEIIDISVDDWLRKETYGYMSRESKIIVNYIYFFTAAEVQESNNLNQTKNV